MDVIDLRIEGHVLRLFRTEVLVVKCVENI